MRNFDREAVELSPFAQGGIVGGKHSSGSRLGCYAQERSRPLCFFVEENKHTVRIPGSLVTCFVGWSVGGDGANMSRHASVERTRSLESASSSLFILFLS